MRTWRWVNDSLLPKSVYSWLLLGEGVRMHCKLWNGCLSAGTHQRWRLQRSLGGLEFRRVIVWGERIQLQSTSSPSVSCNFAWQQIGHKIPHVPSRRSRQRNSGLGEGVPLRAGCVCDELPVFSNSLVKFTRRAGWLTSDLLFKTRDRFKFHVYRFKPPL